LLRRTAETARLMLGVADYDAYVAHFVAVHPDATVLSREAFFRERLAARYRSGGLRCC
jgi:uncharacterized short protein YbdD (DUF466 family)